VNWIANQDQFIFSSISMEFNTLILIYSLLLAILYALLNTKFKSIAFVLLVCIGLQTVLIYNKATLPASEWVLFHKNRQSLLGYRIQNHLNIYSNSDTLQSFNSYPLKAYSITKSIQTRAQKPMGNVYRIKEKNMLVIDSVGVYNIKEFKPYYILLRASPKINLNRIIDSLNPKLIIADGSNYKSYINRWEVTCKDKKIPFYQTGKKGAYVFK